MSDTATDLVWSKSKACRGARLVMLAIARAADDEGEATLPLTEISRATHLSARAITKCLTELAALGELSHRRGGGNSNPNSYAILLGRTAEAHTSAGAELPTSSLVPGDGGTDFPEEASQKHPDMEVSSSRACGGTPYGSTTTQKQASLPVRSERKKRPSEPVNVPAGATELVSAVTGAGMLVGWRLTEPEWDRVTALSDRWGPERLVEMAARRWNASRPPQSARYLLRIWEDLPAHSPSDASAGNVLPLRRQPGTWVPFQNIAKSSAYQNGF